MFSTHAHTATHDISAHTHTHTFPAAEGPVKVTITSSVPSEADATLSKHCTRAPSSCAFRHDSNNCCTQRPPHTHTREDPRSRTPAAHGQGSQTWERRSTYPKCVRGDTTEQDMTAGKGLASRGGACPARGRRAVNLGFPARGRQAGFPARCRRAVKFLGFPARGGRCRGRSGVDGHHCSLRNDDPTVAQARKMVG